MHKYDKTFWMMFVFLEFAIIMGNVWFFSPLGVILGDYILHKEREAQMKRHNQSIEKMKSWLNNQYHLTQGIRDLHDYRFHSMDRKKAELDEKIEEKYRELAKKIIEIENRLNLVSRVVISQNRPQTQQPVEAAYPKPAEKALDAFESVWESITELAEKRGTVRTLSRGIRNKVIEVGSNGIKLRSEITKKERPILKQEFKHFWDILKRKGSLEFTKDVDDPRLVRLGSVIISFLARLPNVEHDIKPRVLYLMEHNTHTLGTLRRHRKRI